MPNRQLYDRIEKLTKQTLLQLHELEQISLELQKVIEENHNLIMENHHLKDRLDAMNSSTHISNQVVEKKERSQSVINLENIYNMESVEKMTRIACFAPKSYLVNIKSCKKAR